METTKLKSLTVKELSELAKTMKLQDYVGLKKQDLIKVILEAEAQKEEKIYIQRLGNRVLYLFLGLGP